MPKNKDIKKVLVIGSGPIIIGQAAEFDYAGTQACRALKEEGVELIVLAGYLAILSDELTELYQNRIINIHPSLIPAFCGPGFYGLHVHEHAFKRGVKVAGATVHFVSPVVDGGPIILQEAMDVSQARSPEEMQKMVLTIEHRILPEAVRLFCNGQLKVENERVEIL